MAYSSTITGRRREQPDRVFRHNEIERFVRHYNQERVHESLGNLTPADVYLGRVREIRTARERLKEQTLRRRRRINRGLPITPEEQILPALYRETLS